MQTAFQPMSEPLGSPDPAHRADARFRPSVTVAAVISRPRADGSGPEYLLVHEHTAEGLRLNNPAGHLEQGESPEQAVVREVLEETACHFTARSFLGVFLARFCRVASPGVPAASEDVTYVRLAYAGTVGEPEPGRALDSGIVGTVWLSHHEIVARRAELRSPLVLRCLDAMRQGRQAPLELVEADPTLWLPERR